PRRPHLRHHRRGVGAPMNEDAHAGILLALGALALRLGLTDAHLAYIRPAMGPVLALAGAVLVVLGGVVLLRPGRRLASVGGATHGHGHDHAGTSRVAWLLIAPILPWAVEDNDVDSPFQRMARYAEAVGLQFELQQIPA